MLEVISIRKSRKAAPVFEACVQAFGCMVISTKSCYRLITFGEGETIEWACAAEGVKIAARYPYSLNVKM